MNNHGAVMNNHDVLITFDRLPTVWRSLLALFLFSYPGGFCQVTEFDFLFRLFSSVLNDLLAHFQGWNGPVDRRDQYKIVQLPCVNVSSILLRNIR